MHPTPSLDTHDLTVLVAARAARTPDAEMACEPDGTRITYGEFADLVARAAAGASALGIGAGTRVSWSLPTSIDALVLSAALHRLGALQNPIIPIYREREFRFCVEQIGASVLFVPGTWRGFEAGPDGLELLVVGAPNLGDDPRRDVDGRRGWWADQPRA